MSDPQAFPDDERLVDAEGTDPDVVPDEDRVVPLIDTPNGDEDEKDDDQIDVEDLP